MEKKVLEVLKPKVKALGFNREELKGVAALIANNLNLDENASEEDTDEAIEKGIESVLPILKIGQSYASRVIEKNRKQNDDDDDDDNNKGNSSQSSKSNKSNSTNDDDSTPEWAKGLVEKVTALTGEVSALKGEKVTNSRRGKLEKLLKDAGTFGTTTLKSFDRMDFKTDEDFEEFMTEVENDLKAYNQERESAGLDVNPPGTGGKGKGNSEVLTDAELEAVANSY